MCEISSSTLLCLLAAIGAVGAQASIEQPVRNCQTATGTATRVCKTLLSLSSSLSLSFLLFLPLSLPVSISLPLSLPLSVPLSFFLSFSVSFCSNVWYIYQSGSSRHELSRGATTDLRTARVSSSTSHCISCPLCLPPSLSLSSAYLSLTFSLSLLLVFPPFLVLFSIAGCRSAS